MPWPDEPLVFEYHHLTATQVEYDCSMTMLPVKNYPLTHEKYDLAKQYHDVGIKGFRSLFHVNEKLLKDC